jgi:alkanesulfonate monooxygenase SsuD/methylene tetrahydromethanopterin reductase-like flavin-dependent oxidoreductase (luciferase family)
MGWGVSIAGSDEEALRLAKRSNHDLGAFILGTPESVVLKLGEFIDAGVEYFQLFFPQHRNIEMTRLFADEVIPELKT